MIIWFKMINIIKRDLLKKILILTVAILLIFAILIIISYENSVKYHPLINNDNILTLTNNSIVTINITPLIQVIGNQTIFNNSQDYENDSFPDYGDNDLDEGGDYNDPQIYGDISIEIKSIEENILTGFVEINILTYPEDTDELLFMVYPKDSEDPVEDNNTLIEIIEKPFELKFAIDTTEFSNGDYILVVASTNADTPEDNPWTSTYKKEIIIEN